jgi:tripeptide aminopeptidase
MVNKNRLSQTFKKLASTDSVSKKEADISNEIRKMLEPMAFEVCIDDAGDNAESNTGNLIIKFRGSDDTTDRLPALMLNAHMDTVEPGTGVKPHFKDGVFTSDGQTILGADDKSAIAIIIETLSVLKEKDLPHGPIEVVFTVCEEIGLLGAKNLDFNLISSKYGYALDTSDINCIITGAPAANRFECVVHGKDAHAGADPENGINAILLASRAISGLQLGRIDHETTSNIGVIDGPGATNIIPSLVRVKGEVRSHDEDKLQNVTADILNAFRQAIDQYKKEHGSNSLPRIEWQVEKEFPKTSIPDNHPVVQMAVKAGRHLGRTIKTKKTGGGSDANIFFEKGIITGVIGTGMREIHSVREFIRLEDMEKTVNLLLSIINIHSKGEN